ncbi:MAG: serine/threonine-protein kinase [Acidobacteria bacterium]|nr:serine/threonine-protein kinase [Acidobacteriota bacterium]
MANPACSQCAAPLESDSHGLCARCLLTMALESPELPTGDSFGNYEPVAVLGEGGMGIVYLAEQSVPLRRMVALKVLKPGLESTALAVRFERERQSLARMEHPNIATIYDAGTSSRGLPYFVMEYVEGSNLTAYCDRAKLDLAARIQLFTQVCHAVDHAHHRGILHRDLKPSNILVLPTPGGPRVKVIDFGLARLQDWHAFAKEQLTGATQIVGTPEYMSPEQAAGPESAVGPATDVYSLGMLLYELLSGLAPFRPEQWGNRTVADVLHVLTSVDPPLMSRRVQDAVLRRALAGDLDAIVSKAAAKDPDRRYPSAGALAADLERHLRHEPVEARRGEHITAASKWIRRHRYALSAALLAVIVGSVAALVANRAPAGLQVTDVVPYTISDGTQSMPSFSPDGTKIVFIWDGPGRDNYDLYTLDSPGAPPRRLTTAPEDDLSPAWSPDGRYIAFLRAVDADHSRLMLLDAASGAERELRLIRGWYDFSMRNLAWSPDGKWLAVNVKGEGRRYGHPHLFSPSTGELRDVLTVADDSEYLMPAISPDGRRLACVRDDHATRTLFVQKLTADYRADGPAERTGTDTAVYFPAFLPSGEIIYRLSLPERTRIARLTGTAGAQPMERFGDDVQNFSISRDGSRVAFARSVRDYDIYHYRKQDSGEWNRVGTIAATSFVEGFPAVSPDGREVAFLSARSGVPQVWVCAWDGSALRQLTSGPVVRRGPLWLPDGRAVRYGTIENTVRKPYVVSANGGPPRPEAPGPQILDYAIGGKAMFLAVGEGNSQRLHRAPVDHPEASVPLTDMRVNRPVFDPQREWAYFASPLKALWAVYRVPTSGGTPEHLDSGIMQVWMGASKDGVYYARQLAKHRYGVFLWSVAERKPILLFETDRAPVMRISLSPDGRDLAMDQAKAEGATIRLATVASW